jgi:hypothetical protein
MATSPRDPSKEAFWRKTLTRFAASGLSVREFCKRERLTEGSFYFWRRTLGQRDRPQKSGKRRPPVAFVPAVVTEALPSCPSITLELAGGQVLRFPESISAERVAELVQALQRRGEP